jgi:hypothetical protein
LPYDGNRASSLLKLNRGWWQENSGTSLKNQSMSSARLYFNRREVSLITRYQIRVISLLNWIVNSTIILIYLSTGETAFQFFKIKKNSSLKYIKVLKGETKIVPECETKIVSECETKIVSECETKIVSECWGTFNINDKL